MKFQLAVLAAALVATSAFAADHDNSRISTTDHSAKAAGIEGVATPVVLPNSDSSAETAPSAPAMVTPVIKPVVAAKPERGLMPLLRSAVIPADTTPLERRTWMALSLATHGAAAFDAYSTRVSLESGRGYERNPLMKPFAGSGMIYPAAQVLPFGVDYLSRRMMRSDNALLRHTWWLPQLAASAGSTWVAVRNLHVAQ